MALLYQRRPLKNFLYSGGRTQNRPGTFLCSPNPWVLLIYFVLIKQFWKYFKNNCHLHPQDMGRQYLGVRNIMHITFVALVICNISPGYLIPFSQFSPYKGIAHIDLAIKYVMVRVTHGRHLCKICRPWVPDGRCQILILSEIWFWKRILNGWPRPYLLICVPSSQGGSALNLTWLTKLVLEEKMFENGGWRYTWAMSWKNLLFAYAKTKALISCAGTTKKQISCAVTNQRLCFRNKDITIILLSISKISSF